MTMEENTILNPDERRRKLLLLSTKEKAENSKQQEDKDVGRVPNLILTNIPRREPSLFDEEEVIAREEALAKMHNAFDFLDSRRYDYSETQTLLALCYLCSNDEGEDILKFIGETENENIAQSKYVSRRILLKDLSHFIFNDRKAVHVNAILKDILSLGAIPLKWIYELKDDRGRKQTRMKIAPILWYDIDIPIVDGRKLTMDEVAAKIAEDGYIDVTFGRPFFQGITNRFGYIKKRVITDWGSGGTKNSDPLTRLSPLLLSWQYQFRKASEKARGAAIAEAKKDKLSREQREALIEERVKAALTRDLTLSYINGLLKYDFFKARQYDRLRKQVQAVIDFYKDKGLLLDGYLGGKGRDTKVYFVFNPHFGHKALLSGGEQAPDETP